MLCSCGKLVTPKIDKSLGVTSEGDNWGVYQCDGCYPGEVVTWYITESDFKRLKEKSGK